LLFFPPELAAESEWHGVGAQAFDGKAEWIRTVYFQRLRNNSDPALDRELVNLVLDRARSVVAHPSRPMLHRVENFEKAPFGELALEETLEENPSLSIEQELLMAENVEKPFSCVTLLDASASMSGDKHLLASIAVAVLLLEVPSKDTSLVVFSSHAKTIKRLLQEESREATILRFLKVQPKGFTNIYAGLEEGLKQFGTRGTSGRKVGLIATDGRSTEGGDPLESAAKYDFLVVLHLHGPGSHLEASEEIAQKGHGICLEVERFEELPRRLYEAVRLLARL